MITSPHKYSLCSVGTGLLLLAASFAQAQSLTDGPLSMEPITAYNLVVDSNVETPSSNSPSAAHLGVRIRNTGTTALTDIVVNLGHLITPATRTGTPGVFASRTVTETTYSGTFALQMPGGATDAVRTFSSLDPGESVVQYFYNLSVEGQCRQQRHRWGNRIPATTCG